MKEQSASGILNTTIEKVRQLVDVSTIVGEPIRLSDEITVIPVSKVTYGFASGGSDLPTKKENRDCFGGGSGAGVTIQPLGFLSISKGVTKFIPIEKYDGAADRIVGMIPEAFDKISSFIKKDKDDKTDLENDLDKFEA